MESEYIYIYIKYAEVNIHDTYNYILCSEGGRGEKFGVGPRLDHIISLGLCTVCLKASLHP